MSTLEPRLVPGLPVPSSFNIPNLAEVRKQLTIMMELRKASTVMSAGEWVQRFEGLFQFCIYVQIKDVPDDILEDMIIISKVFLFHMDEQLGGVFPSREAYRLSELVRMKLVVYFTKNNINHPDDALIEVEKQVLEHKTYVQAFNPAFVDKPWIDNLPLYSRYADILIMNNKFDDRTKTLLEHVIESTSHQFNTDTPNIVSYASLAHMHLGLLMQEIGVNDDVQKRHVDIAARYFRRNRAGSKDAADLFLHRPDQSPHPVTLALGEEWFTERPSARDDRRLGKFCMYCSKNDLKVSLSQCSRCQRIYYCSKECQKTDWKSHKPTCNGYVQERKFLEALQKIDPQMARQAADMSKWRNGDHYANLDAMIHALNLQRDPSRGKTHIIFRTLENTPGPRVPKDYRDRIRVTRCTVFKVEDILGDMCQLSEGRPRPNKEEIFKEIQAAIAVALQELPNGEPDPNAPPRSNWSKSSRDIPVLDFTFGPGFHPVVNAVPVSEDYVRGLKYNPNWRQVINGDQGTPPRPFIAPSGALDAEHTF